MLSKKISPCRHLWISSPHNIGDFIAKVPLIRLLKKNFPDLILTVAARHYVKDLIDVIKEVDHFVDFEAFFSQEDSKIIHDFKELQIDSVLHVLSQQKAMGPDVLSYAQKAHIPIRIGNVYRSLTSLWLKNKKGPLTHNLCAPRIIQGMHEFQWNLKPLRFWGLSSEVSTEEVATLLYTEIDKSPKSRFIKGGTFNVLMHPGSHGNAKDWPLQSYQEVIEKLQGSGVNIILTGSAKEALIFSSLKKLDSVTFAMGQSSLKELIELVSQVDLVIGSSSGPVHLAALFHKPTLALFPHQPALSASVWGPLNPMAQVISADRVCTSCQKKLTDFNPSLCTCMMSITPDDVFNNLVPRVRHESSF